MNGYRIQKADGGWNLQLKKNGIWVDTAILIQIESEDEAEFLAAKIIDGLHMQLD